MIKKVTVGNKHRRSSRDRMMDKAHTACTVQVLGSAKP